MRACVAIAAGVACDTAGATSSTNALSVREYPVPAGSRPHDVAPARDGGVWYTAQGSGELGTRKDLLDGSACMEDPDHASFVKRVDPRFAAIVATSFTVAKRCKRRRPQRLKETLLHLGR